MAQVLYIDKLKGGLGAFLSTRTYQNIFILADTNTYAYCYPLLPEYLRSETNTHVIEAGDDHKTLLAAESIWHFLLERNADRQSLLINLGGGMVTDIGGFAAATFKRGIEFLNMPTTLLGMADAAIGGKTGINYRGLKNQIGSFSLPSGIVIYPGFLSTLPQRQIISGFAEVLKYALVFDKELWPVIQKFNPSVQVDWMEIVKRSVHIKESITHEDPFEKGIRKILNFGHTIGHAIESLSVEKDGEHILLHGEAIAAGMVAEAYLSAIKCGLPVEALEDITNLIYHHFPKVSLERQYDNFLLELMRHDKKNRDSELKFALLKQIGHAVADISCTTSEIRESLDYCREVWKD